VGPNGKLSRINFKETINRIELLKTKLTHVECIWECEADEEFKNNKEMKDFFSDCQTCGRLNPRDAYFGGLTCAFKMIENSDESHELSMFDVISLYPYSNFIGPYPLDHPKLIIPEETNVVWTQPSDVNYEGIFYHRYKYFI
jgi:hypothetical protein